MTNGVGIRLTQGYTAFVDPVDADLLVFRWCVLKFEYQAYAVRKHCQVCLHRVVLERMLHRALLPGEESDPVDGDTLNCRRSNLRLTTHMENHNKSKRKSKNNSSGFKGVHFNQEQGKWEARIQINSRRRRLGFFETAELANEAYCEAAKDYRSDTAGGK